MPLSKPVARHPHVDHIAGEGLGALDEDGYLFLAGRIKNLINRGGEKIAPEHVEDIIAGCPGIAEVRLEVVPALPHTAKGASQEPDQARLGVGLRCRPDDVVGDRAGHLRDQNSNLILSLPNLLETEALRSCHWRSYHH